jgi:hypothetical protein
VHKILCNIVYAKIETGEVVVGYLNAVDANTFVHPYQMGRGIKTSPVACGLQNAGQSGGGRAFAVGSGDEDGGERLLQIAEGRAEGAHMGQLPLAAGCAGAGGELVAEGVEALDGAIVVCSLRHVAILAGVASCEGRRIRGDVPHMRDKTAHI